MKHYYKTAAWYDDVTMLSDGVRSLTADTGDDLVDVVSAVMHGQLASISWRSNHAHANRLVTLQADVALGGVLVSTHSVHVVDDDCVRVHPQTHESYDPSLPLSMRRIAQAINRGLTDNARMREVA